MVKGPRWSQDKWDLCNECPHSRAIMVWGCQGVRMVIAMVSEGSARSGGHGRDSDDPPTY